MIRGERVIQLNMALLILTGALLLSIAQDDYGVLTITAVSVTFSLLIVDWLRLISFHPLVVNALAFGVTFVSFTEFLGGNTGTKLNAVASLLTYLQLVLLLQRKSPRLYWQIMMLSLLQVVVAAALNLDFSAGVVFFCYIMFVVIGTIHLKIYRGNFRLAEHEKRNDQLLDDIGDSHENLPGVGVLTFRASTIDFRNEKKIAWQGFLFCVCALFFSFSVFYSIPRFGSAWHGPGGNQSQQTGFAKEIRFDDYGFLQESNRNVFRATFLDEENKPIELAVEPYFKGLLLTDYGPVENGYWSWTNSRNENPGSFQQNRVDLKEPSRKTVTYMRQVVRLEPSGKVRFQPNSDSHLLFSVFPVFKTKETTDDVVYNAKDDILFCDANEFPYSANSPFHYELLTPLYRNLGQLPAVPVSLTANNAFALLALEDTKNRLLGKSNDRFRAEWKAIADLASKVASEVSDKESRRMICNRLSNYFQRVDFKYTRNLDRIERDESLDPIVDFLTNHRSGHCEYYATGLALMLRSQGIPCRVVTGYRGGEFNALGGFYLVKEKHAHVWVEAYLRPEDCDANMIKTGQAGIAGAWLRLDPTPVSDETEITAATTLFDRAFDAIGFAQKIWDDYVTGLDQDSREFNGFDPTTSEANFSWGAIGYVNRILAGINRRFQMIPWWQWILICGLALIILVCIFYLRTRKKLAKLGQVTSTGNVFRELYHSSIDTVSRFRDQVLGSRRTQRPTIDFYQEFQKIMTAAGFVRQDAETPKEFGATVAQQLSVQHPLESETINEAIESITDSFYVLRFGDHPEQSKIRASARIQLQKLKKVVALR